MKIRCRSTNQGVELEIQGKRYSLNYPKEIWKDYPPRLKKIFADNYAFLKALHLPQMLNNGNKIYFDNSYPLFKNEIYNCFLNTIPFCADADGISTEENIKRFINLEISFKDFEITYPKYSRKLKERSVLNMSFGKDSLLTYAIASEIGIKPNLVYSADDDCKLENLYKSQIAKKFSSEFGEKIWVIQNNIGKIHRPAYWNVGNTEWGFAHLITEYSLKVLPFSNYFRAKYILLGNEKSCDNYYFNKEGYKSYPVFDQSSEWTIELSKMTRAITGNQAIVMSLIEPLHELAIIRILHSRYPEIGKYQMSCFPDDNVHGKNHYWCQHCSKCARIYLFMKANGFDPRTIGFTEDMFGKEYRSLYSIFGVKGNGGTAVAYDLSGVGRDEQMYAFLLAYRLGSKGPLIDEFKADYIEEALKREEEFKKEFYGIQESKTIPSIFIEKVKNIYREELSKV